MHEKVVRQGSRLCAIILGIAAALAPAGLGSGMSLGVDPAERECLVAAIYHEARGEPVKAQRAVAEVVLNRAWKSGKSVCEVVAARRQFAWYAKHKIKVMDSALARLLDNAFKQQRILENENFLYFYSGSTPIWAKGMSCRPLGRLRFCKEKKLSSRTTASTASTQPS